MPRESKISYEMVRDAFYSFMAKHERMPTNLEMQKILGGASDIISDHMKILRAEERAKKKVSPLVVPKHLVTAYSADIMAGVAEQTRDINEHLKEAVEDADNLRSDLGRTREDLAGVQDALDKACLSNAVLKTQLADARIEVHRMAGELTRISDEVSRLNQRNGGLESELATERQKVTKLEDQVAVSLAAQTAMAEQVESLQIWRRLL